VNAEGGDELQERGMPPLALDLWKLKSAPSVHELARHYRRLSKLYHPDLQALDDREQYQRHMQQINEAYTEALKRFNIYTYRNPGSSRTEPTIHVELITDPPPPPQQPRAERPTARPAPPPPFTDSGSAPGVMFAASEAARRLGKAMASLKHTRSFFSLGGCTDQHEREQYRDALEILEEVHRRFPSFKEGQDALYYAAVCYLKLADYPAALNAFAKHRQRYPEDSRNGLIYFYSGICFHHLSKFDAAVREYGCFLLAGRTGESKYFSALVVTYKEAAERQVIPATLPYG
jgi:tetratricopeptide (TPR) repeat protein